jgi:hypothetical protein
MAKLETVKIKSANKGGFIRINKSDLTNKHDLFVEKLAKKETPKKAKINIA